MKQTIEWHAECLKNNKSNLDREREEAKRVQDRFLSIELDYERTKEQYELALKEKKDGYDQDKYAKKRLKNKGSDYDHIKRMHITRTGKGGDGEQG